MGALRVRSTCLVVALLAAAPAAQASAVPRPSKVVIVIFENRTRSQIVGDACCGYFSTLAGGGADFTQSFAVTHPSQPNYIALFSGSQQSVTDNAVHAHTEFVAPNLGSKLREAGYTFGGFAESLPIVGYDGTVDEEFYPYSRRHNPWVNWQDDNAPAPGVANPTGKLPPSVNRPFTEFPQGPNADYATLPDVSIVIPNELHNMHDRPRAEADAWLQQTLSGYADWAAANDGLLILTFDEDDFAHNNLIPTVFYGQVVAPGSYAETIDHYRVLRTLEDAYGLPHYAATVGASHIDLWKPSAWHRAAKPLDVDGDGTVAPLDALIVINNLDFGGARQLDLSPAVAPRSLIDTNADYFLAPIDALLVINFLDDQISGLGAALPAALELPPVAVPELSSGALACMALVAFAARCAAFRRMRPRL